MSREGHAVVTVVSRDYLAHAVALKTSLEKSNPQLSFFICMLDRLATAEIELPFPEESIFYADELKIPHWKRFAFQYTPFELACALKPHALRKLMQWGFERVLYLDSDVQVYAPLDSVFEQLQTSSVYLTPHLCGPIASEIDAAHETEFLKSGAFNAGWLGVANTEVGHQFLDWWSHKTSQWCINDQNRGFFVDQRWLDLVPGLFDNIFISRNPGLNVGHWSLKCADLSLSTDGKLLVGGQTLVSFHFSGYDPKNPERMSRYQPKLKLAELPLLKPLFEKYHSLLLSSGWDSYSILNCEYHSLPSGEPILPEWRKRVREDKTSDLADPFEIHYE